MRIYTMWGQRKESYIGEYALELMVACDEMSVEKYPEGFQEICEEAKMEWGDELEEFRMINLEVPEQAIESRFTSEEIQSSVVPEDRPWNAVVDRSRENHPANGSPAEDKPLIYSRKPNTPPLDIG